MTLQLSKRESKSPKEIAAERTYEPFFAGRHAVAVSRRLQRNTDEEISDALRLAAIANTDRAAIAVLRGLSGVDIPLGSAVLTTIRPELYTIIDFRALESLGVSDPPVLTVEYYLEYLRACRSLAEQQKISLRVLDRALWQWSFEKSQERRNSGVVSVDRSSK